ncbi:hypothetical protein [Streptomyces carpaticus]|uniref:Uncharacterized protein n=1 Tax=Streptomyces carpaticus TaxID=285558 RepID=A0ABV4ZM87_9ACTN
MTTGDGGRARLVHRLPVPLRQHGKPVAALVVTLALLLVYFGDTRVSALVTSASDGDGEQITQNIAGITDLYDSATEHTVSLEYDEADYQRLITAFEEDGDKEWTEADLTIDGTFIESVGVRLKGNSTLSSPGGDAEMGGMGGNILKERFLEPAAFDDVYLDAYRDLYQQWFASGGALETLDAVLEAAGANGADPDALAATADRLRATLTERAAAPAADETVTG